MIRDTTPGGKHRPKKSAPSPGLDGGRFKATPSKKQRVLAFLRHWWWAFVAPPVVIFLLLVGTLWYVYARTSIPEVPPGAQTTFVYDRHGKLFATLHAGVDRVPVPLSDIAPSLQHAVIATEDKDFYNHGGVSFFSIIRAGVNDLLHRKIEQGGSTIDQQYAKNVYTGSQRTLTRKIKEAIIAVKLDHKYSKDQILEKYLNVVYFGNGAYGVEAAAQTYWGIHASKLDVLQSATLAGLIQSPATYAPIDHSDAARARRDTVLDLMAQEGYINHSEAADLKAQPVKVNKEPPSTLQGARFPYFTSYVSKILQDQFTYEEVFEGGLKVTTTLDAAYQRAAEKAVATHLSAPGDPSVAVVAIDPATGQIRALVGGKNFNKVKLNTATQAHRQPGSSFKPFTLTAAVGENISPKSVWSGPPRSTSPVRCARTPTGRTGNPTTTPTSPAAP